METEESWDDEWPDDEYEEDSYDDDEAEVVPCPSCGEEVYEDVDCCPYCGNYIVHSSSGYVWNGRPTWWIVLGLIGILAVIVALALGP